MWGGEIEGANQDFAMAVSESTRERRGMTAVLECLDHSMHPTMDVCILLCMYPSTIRLLCICCFHLMSLSSSLLTMGFYTP